MFFFHELKSVPSFLYIHYPSCAHVCSYCDFNVWSSQSLVTKFGPHWESLWLEGLKRQVLSWQEDHPSTPLKTIYLGGGTPGLMQASTLSELVKFLNDRFDLSGVLEWTIECNPENISEDKLKLFKSLGINRVSMGVQSFGEKSLKRLERLSTASKIQASISLLQNYFSNWTMDLMLGVPEQSLSDLDEELRQLEKIQPPHFSAYLLTIPDDHKWLKSKAMKATLCDPDSQLEYFLKVDEWARAQSYQHYELSNYGKKDRLGVHNSNYWQPQSGYLALGPGAHGYVQLKSGEKMRFEMQRDFGVWSSGENQISERELLTKEQQEIEALYLGLRVRRPIDDPALLKKLEQNSQLHSHFDFFSGQAQLRPTSWPLMDQIALQLLSI